MSERIVLFGTGGVGKSTVAANVSVALAKEGFRVLLVGCGEKADSCSFLRGGMPLPTVSVQHRQQRAISYDSVIRCGYQGVFCLELGGLTTPVTLVLQGGLLDSLSSDVILFDVSGGYSDCSFLETLLQYGDCRIYAVTTADYTALTAVNAVVGMTDGVHGSHRASFAGVITNGLTSSFDESFVEDFSGLLGIRTIGGIPRSLIVRQCELYGKTVMEASPLSHQSHFYRFLADRMAKSVSNQSHGVELQALTAEQMRTWAREWADRLFAIENGLVNDGAAI